MPYKSILIATLTILGACDTPDCNSEMRNIYAKPASSWPSLISQMPLEDQYTTYLCGVRFMHPPPDGLAAKIAERGEPAGYLAVKKLEAASDPIESLAALNILVEVSRKFPSICKKNIEGAIASKLEDIERPELRRLYSDTASDFCKGLL